MFMKSAKNNTESSAVTMLPHYDFTKGDKPNYAKRFSGGAVISIHSSNGKAIKKKLIKKQSLIILDADVSEVFPDTKSVNTALRHLIAALPQKARKAA